MPDPQKNTVPEHANPVASSPERLKTSRDHAMELAGQFLGLASAGIAFVVGLVFATERLLHPWIVVVVCVLFAASVVFGLMVRMGAASDIHKKGPCDAYGKGIQRVAALQVVLFLLGTSVLAAATFHRVFAQRENGGGRVPGEHQPRWIETGKGMIDNISGLALVEHDSSRTILLAVHDNKEPEQPRLTLLTRRTGEPGVERRPVAWPDSAPIDLEAICRVPGKGGEFLTLTSKGDLHRIKLDRKRAAVVVQAFVKMPNAGETIEFESLDVQVLGSKMIACWAQRGSSEVPGVVSCATLDVERLTFGPTSDAIFTSPWPAAHARHLSDLRVTETGAVLATATTDPGDLGPYASALYLAGEIDHGGGKVTFVPEPSIVRLWIDEGHKIEAIEQVPGATGGLVFGADDEASGGAILFTW